MHAGIDPSVGSGKRIDHVSLFGKERVADHQDQLLSHRRSSWRKKKGGGTRFVDDPWLSTRRRVGKVEVDALSTASVHFVDPVDPMLGVAVDCNYFFSF